MAAETTKKFRLTIWKPANHAKRLLLFSQTDSGRVAHQPSDFEFHEELYSWEPQEDIWLSVTTSGDQQKLRALLVESFGPEKPAEDRSVGRLAEVIEALKAIIKDSSKTAWADCERSEETDDGRTLNLRCHGMIALHNHLAWLHDVFQAVPGASVTLR